MNRIARAAFSFALVLAAAAPADTIELKDGRKFSGRAVTQGARVLITTDDGATLETTTANIQSIKQVGSLTRDELAAVEWKRIAAAARNAPDLKTVILLHERFLQQFPDAASSETARTSLDNFRRIADGGGLKYRGEWISNDDFDAIRKAWKQSAEPAAIFYRAGQLKEAQNAAAVILAREPHNQDALAVAGLTAYRAGNLALAMRYFVQLADTTPASVMAHHNLAIIYLQRKDIPNAVRQYTRALQIMPTHRLLLDNITELVHSYDQDKNLPHYKALLLAWEQAESRLQAEMLKEKLHRWGSTWVAEEQLEKLTKALDEVRAEMRTLDARYKGVRTILPQVEEQIVRSREEVRAHEAVVINISVPGTLVTRGGGPSPTYHDLSLERTRAMENLEHARMRLQALEGRRTELLGQITEMETKAKGLKSQLTQTEPQFTGIHRIMDLGEVETPPPYPALSSKYEPLLAPR